MGAPVYVPCGKPAAYVVKNNDPRPYVMCAACADHNVKNRNAKIVQKGEKHAPIAVIEASPISMKRASEKRKINKDDAHAQIKAMVEVLQAVQNNLAIAADKAAKIAEEVRRIEMEALPLLLTELGISDIGLKDGSRVTLIEELKVSITEARKLDAFAWLRKKGDGGIIKVKIVTDVGNDTEGEAVRLLSRIEKIAKGLPVNTIEEVHNGTLRAYVREQRERGVTVPIDLFGIHVFSRAKLTPPKKR